MTDRRIEVFFYGLFMDPDILRESKVEPDNPRHAFLDGFRLCIGRRATLISAPGARAYGMVFALTNPELDSLYSAPGLELYRPEAVLAESVDGISIPALCYNLGEAPEVGETNTEYAIQLKAVLRKLGFPAEYIASIQHD